MKRCRLAALLLVACPSGAAVADTSSRGSIAVEGRAFVPDEHESTEDYGVAVTSSIDVKSRTGPWQLALRGFARADAIDETREIVVVEEAYVAFNKDPLSIVVGPQILNWTATEAFHPADIINSRNLDSDVESPEKIGEPMVAVRYRVREGYVAAYYMPVRMEPNLPPDNSRLSLLPVSVELGEPLWVDRDGQPSEEAFANQGALQATQTFGAADVAVHAVHHSDRSLPSITTDPVNGDLRPTYHTVTQAGMTYVHVFGGLIVKVEAAYRWWADRDRSVDYIDKQVNYGQVAGGLEYGWTTAAGHDATFVVEGQYAESPGSDRPTPFLLFQRGVLLGYQHFLNDEKGRRLLATFITDARTPYEYVASLGYHQRVSDEWTVDATARALRLSDFGAEDDANQIHLIATQFQLRMTRHF